MKTPKVSRYRQHQSFRWIENSKFSKLQSRKSVFFLEKMWKKKLARHNITYHLSSTVILKKSVQRSQKISAFPHPRSSRSEVTESKDTKLLRCSTVPLELWDPNLAEKSEKNVSKCRSRLTLHLEKKHRLGRSELGFSPANSANKFSSSEVQIAMLASLPRCWELHAITSYKNCTTHRVNQSNLGKSRVCTDCYTVSTAKIYFRNCFFSCFCFCSIQTEAKTVRIDCHARACNVSQILDKWRMFWVEAKDSGEWTTWLSMGSSQQHVFLQSTSQQH